MLTNGSSQAEFESSLELPIFVHSAESVCPHLSSWVSIPEDLSHISVNFANINEHYAEWPEEIQSAWLRAGAWRA